MRLVRFILLPALCLLTAPATAVAQSPRPNKSRAEANGAITESADEIGTRLSQFDTPFSYGPLAPYLDRWDGMLERANAESGLELGFSYTVLLQAATGGTYRGPSSGSSGDFDVLGRWRPFRDCKGNSHLNDGILGFELEYRHRIGQATPAALGGNIGSLWNTTSGFNELNFSLVQFWWQQKLFHDTFSIRLGQIDASLIFDAYRFNSPNFFFLNQAFSDNPTIPFPESGLGVVGTWNPTDEWFAILGFADADGLRTETAAPDALGLDAWFTALTTGWRGPVGSFGNGLYQVTAWHSDKRSGSSRPSATGFSVLAQQEIGNGWVPYLRYAYSDDNATDTQQLLTGGIVAERPLGRERDRFGLSLGWGRPHDPKLQSQWVGEVFYRFELFRELQLTPAFQLIVNPSRNTSAAAIGLFSLRARLNF